MLGNCLFASVLLLISYFHLTDSKIKCYEYDHLEMAGMKNMTISCPDPANYCYSVRNMDGETLKRSCVWEDHCTETNLCGLKAKCNLYCCTTDYCNSSVSKHSEKLGKLIFGCFTAWLFIGKTSLFS